MSADVHICRGVNRLYQARVRYAGDRRYWLLDAPTKSKRKALRQLADAFASGLYKRGDVLFWSDYYEPIQVVEMVRP